MTELLKFIELKYSFKLFIFQFIIRTQDAQEQQIKIMQYSNIASNYSNFSQPGVMRSGQVMVANRGLQHINCILPSQNNRGGLYLGDVVCLLKGQLLQKHQIKSILTCMVEPTSKTQHNIVSHKILPLRDNIQFPISGYFQEAYQFIDEARGKGLNVLVHCHAGVSRSASIVCAYLMLENKWELGRTIEFVRQKRYRAKPNASFMSQLQKFYHMQVKHKLNQDPKFIEKPLSSVPIIQPVQKRNLLIEPKQPKVNYQPLYQSQVPSQIQSRPQQRQSFRIVLDQQTEIHDQLFQLEQRKSFKNTAAQKYKALGMGKSLKNIISYDSPQKSHISLKQQKKSQNINVNLQKNSQNQNQTMRDTMQNLSLNGNLNQNKSEIYFNKVFDPKLMRSNVEMRQINSGEQSNRAFLNPNNHFNSDMTKSLVTPNIINFSNVNANMYKTPTKQKGVFQDNRGVYTNSSRIQPEIDSQLTYTQKASKGGQNRYSLASNVSGYRHN